jgi:hypothetical protein
MQGGASTPFLDTQKQRERSSERPFSNGELPRSGRQRGELTSTSIASYQAVAAPLSECDARKGEQLDTVGERDRHIRDINILYVSSCSQSCIIWMLR